jgi:hypothetical protein
MLEPTRSAETLAGSRETRCLIIAIELSLPKVDPDGGTPVQRPRTLGRGLADRGRPRTVSRDDIEVSHRDSHVERHGQLVRQLCRLATAARSV